MKKDSEFMKAVRIVLKEELSRTWSKEELTKIMIESLQKYSRLEKEKILQDIRDASKRAAEYKKNNADGCIDCLVLPSGKHIRPFFSSACLKGNKT